MATLTDYLINLTDHRDREWLAHTVAKAVVELLPVQAVLITRLSTVGEQAHWDDVVTLTGRGSTQSAAATGTVADDLTNRIACLQNRATVLGPHSSALGQRKTYLPLITAKTSHDGGIMQLTSQATLTSGELKTIAQLLHVYGNMNELLAYSDRDALTGLHNRKALDDDFYSAVLEELDLVETQDDAAFETQEAQALATDQERRHRVPPNYWLGMVSVDAYASLAKQHPPAAVEQMTAIVARLLLNTFRTHDRLYHLGRGEFAVLLHCPLESLALGAFERVRINVEKFNFPQISAVTVSAGFTRVLGDDSPATGLERTEEAIEFVQKNGGNQVRSYPDMVRRSVSGMTPLAQH